MPFVSSDFVERPKPFPDIYVYALNKFNVKKELAFAIEDSLDGFKSAKGAGIKEERILNIFTSLWQPSFSNWKMVAEYLSLFI